jgi:hypothetical protein
MNLESDSTDYVSNKLIYYTVKTQSQKLIVAELQTLYRTQQFSTII